MQQDTSKILNVLATIQHNALRCKKIFTVLTKVFMDTSLAPSSRPPLILGIETSCDDTSIALVAGDGTIHSHHTASQCFKEYGGVVPELAARSHIDVLDTLLCYVLKHSAYTLADITAVAATCGPGLIGGVVVGAMYGKGLASSLNIPFLPINHLEGHALTIRLTEKLPYPYLLLLVSGGHCQFIDVQNLGVYQLLGQTIDDAAGEAFDKVANMLDLPYPGGPHIERLAAKGNPLAFDFPRPLFKKCPPQDLAPVFSENSCSFECDFSFSGLKTAVRHVIERHKQANTLDETTRFDICASFQAAVSDCLINRSEHAIRMMPHLPERLVIAGGVAANRFIFNRFKEFGAKHGMTVHAPPVNLCTDNAAMIAWAGIERFLKHEKGDLGFEPRPRWPLCDLKPPCFASQE